MTNSPNLLSQLEQLLAQKKSKKYYAEKLGITEAEVTSMLEELRGKDKVEDSAQSIKRVNLEQGSLESVIEIGYEPKNDEELAQLHKINLDKYKISNYWTKLKSNGKFTSSVFATLKKPDDYTIEEFTKFLENYNPKYLQREEKTKTSHGVDVEISIADFHLGKKTLEEETIQDKESHFLHTIKSLIKKVDACFNINTIIFPISNDFFHTDNYQNSTTNGTPQDILMGFDSEYELGFDLLVRAIDLLRNYCSDMEVILVQGNHDRTKSFYVAHALEMFFRDDVKIRFDREHRPTKWITVGETFIGYHHGNCKIDELPLVFATNKDSSESFGMSKYREVHTGDKHHYMAKEIKGVRIQQMPSLSGTDRWHLDNNYVNNIRAGLALVYHPIQGKVAEFEERI